MGERHPLHNGWRLEALLVLLLAGPAWPWVQAGLLATGLGPAEILMAALLLSNGVVFRTLRREDARAWRGWRPGLQRLARPVGGLAVVAVGTAALAVGEPDGSAVGWASQLAVSLQLATRLGLGLALSGHLLRETSRLRRVSIWGGRLVIFCALALTTLIQVDWHAARWPALGLWTCVALGMLQSEGIRSLLTPASAPPVRPPRLVYEESRDTIVLHLPAAGEHRDVLAVRQAGVGAAVGLAGLGLAAARPDIGPLLFVGVSGGSWLLMGLLRWLLARLVRVRVRFFPHRAEVRETMGVWSRVSTVEARALEPRLVHDPAGPMLVLGDGVVVAADVPEDLLKPTLERVRAGLIPEDDDHAAAVRERLAPVRPESSTGGRRGRWLERSRDLGLLADLTFLAVLAFSCIGMAVLGDATEAVYLLAFPGLPHGGFVVRALVQRRRLARQLASAAVPEPERSSDGVDGRLGDSHSSSAPRRTDARPSMPKVSGR